MTISQLRHVDPAAREYAVSVALEGGDHALLLSLVSMLHRRGVEVLEADLSRPTEGRRVFNASVSATASQARTLAASLRGVIHVVDVSLYDADDDYRQERALRSASLG